MTPSTHNTRRSCAQLGVQLALPTSTPTTMRGAVLQQAIGEAAGGLPDVQAGHASDNQTTLAQRASSFRPPRDT